MKICKRCNLPVKVYESEYEIFECMHWICFHYEFEHGENDPDEPCDDPSCPWNRINDKNQFIYAHEKSFVLKGKRQFIGITYQEVQIDYYPSVSFRIAIEAVDNYVVNNSVWFEKNDMLDFTHKINTIGLDADVCILKSMSPDEFEIKIQKNRQGHYELNYRLQRVYLSEQRAEINGNREIDYEELKRLSKYFEEVVSFI